MTNWHKGGKRRIGASILLFLFAVGFGASTLFSSPKPVNAQVSVLNPDIMAWYQGSLVKDSIGSTLLEAAVVALVNSTNYFSQQIAYQMALSILGDCPGQKSCWDSKAIGQMFREAALGAVGEAIGSLNEELQLQKLGFDLCRPNLNMALKIQLGLLDEYKPPPPKCSWETISNSYSALAESLDSGQFLENMRPQFVPGQSPIGVQVGIVDGIWVARKNAEREATMKRLTEASSGGGFSDLRDQTSGRIKSPASVTKAEFQDLRDQRSGTSARASTERANAGSIAAKASIAIGLNAAQTFTMTIVSRLWNKFVNGLLSTEELLELQPDLIFNPEAILQPPGEEGLSQIQTQRTVTAVPVREASTFDPLTEFAACPGIAAGPDNCVIDTQFANAVRAGDVYPLTVEEALEKKLLHSDWPLISSNDKQKDTDPFCYSAGYCESNLKKLRAYRIIPIGWELAAHKSSVTSPATLGEVVAGFDNCNASGVADDANPWCHLINPKWVLKSPPAQCRAKVSGPILESSETNARRQVCADVATCLRQDDVGACTGGWGYCLNERNAWRFNGDQCPFYYNSCRSFKVRSGGSESYLLNSVDHGVCNADNVGCAKYSTTLNAGTCSSVYYCLGGTNNGRRCTTDANCGGGDCGPDYCEGGSRNGKFIDATVTSGMCNAGGGSVVQYKGCPLDTGCTCENPTPKATCQVVKGKDVCTDDFGQACRLNYVCGDSTCLCEVKLSCRAIKGQQSCTSIVGNDAVDGDDWLLDPQRYFNKNVQECAVTDNGCSALIPLGTSGSLNLVRNGSFEELEDGDGDGVTDHARYWTPFGAVAAAGNGSINVDPKNVASGTNAVRAKNITSAASSGICTTSKCTEDNGCTCTSGSFTCKVIKGKTSCAYTDTVTQSHLPVRRRVTYTMTATFMPDAGASKTAGGMLLQFVDSYGKLLTLAPGDVVQQISFTPDLYGEPQKKTVLDASRKCDVDVSGNLLFTFATEADVGKITASCTFVVDKDISYATLTVGGNGGAVYVDDVIFEEGAGTAYHEGYNVASNSTYAKIPPAFLGCTGDETERPECLAFSGVCRENEVGCERYTPTNGDPAVPGIVGPQDSCPAECAGYDVFKQESTAFDNVKFPVYFIPTTAKQCGQEESGCSEFTDLGTEQLEYYSGLRLCEKPSTDEKTVYYTWEGSDATGYQLRVWNLKRTVADVKNRMKPDGTVAAADPALVGTMSEVAVALGSTNAGFAPCTRLDAATASVCTSIDNGTGTDKNGLCTRDDIDAGNFDCREYYDADGNRHYRLSSKTIVLTEECRQYRITTSTAADCSNSNGRWDSERAQCIYNAAPNESSRCSAAGNGCRPYKGNAATNVRNAVFDSFEDGVSDWTGGTQSSESVVVGGHSLKFTGASTAKRQVGGLVSPSRSYSLSFWARGNGTMETSFGEGVTFKCKLPANCDLDDGCECVTPTGLKCPSLVPKGSDQCDIPAPTFTVPAAPASLNFSDDSSTTSAAPATLTTDWKLHTFGPLSVDDDEFGVESTMLVFKKNGSGDAYVDNVILTEVQDNIYVIRNSWVTPASCDQTPQGVPSPQEMLGCKEYKNTAQATVYLRSFTSLCRDRAVGCQAYSFTQNTPQNPQAQTFNAVCQLKDNVGKPRQCGRCTKDCPAGGAPCACNDGYASCTVAPGGKYCDDSNDSSFSGSACVCNYDRKNLIASLIGAPQEIGDACRVSIGESECRFPLDQPDLGERQGDFPDRVNVPADERMYLVVRPANTCSAAAMACKAMGIPEIIYEGECSNKDAFGTVSECASDAGCKCTLNNAECTISKGSTTCTASFEKGVVGQWKAVAVKDDPALYEKNLCTVPALYCEEYSAADGIYYFRKPGNRVCEYKEGITVGAETRFGWFRKSPSGADIPCYPELVQNGEYYALYKNADPTCVLPGADVCKEDAGCLCTIPPASVPTCLVQKGNTTCGYQAWAGACSAQYDRCEEFVDPGDTSVLHPRGTPYYYIANNKLDLKSCNGQPSLENGCILFNQTSNTRLTYSSPATYLKSDAQANGGSVAPVDCNTETRNALCEKRCKGIKDGSCQTTLQACSMDSDCPAKACSGSKQPCETAADCGGGQSCGAVTKKCLGPTFYGPGCIDKNGDGKDDGKDESNVCGYGQTCSSDTEPYPYSFTKNDTNTVIRVRKDRECAQWLTCTLSETSWDVNEGKWKNICGGFAACAKSRQVGETSECSDYVYPPRQLLTESLYQKRDVTYKGLEYAGYSLPNKYPMQYIVLSKAGQGVKGKLYGIDTDDIPQECDADDDCPNGALCYDGRCAYALSGGPLANEISNQSWCRGYPEVDAPYSGSVVSDSGYNTDGTPKSLKSGWSGANVCNQNNDCECSYKRISWGKGGESRFYGLFSPKTEPPSNVCIGGPNEGKSCTPGSDDCVKAEGGKCQGIFELQASIGWEGFCVDPDYSFNINGDQNQFACNLWLPVDRLIGTPDINNQSKEAGYVPSEQKILFCKQGEGNGAVGNTYVERILDQPAAIGGSARKNFDNYGSIWENSCCEMEKHFIPIVATPTHKLQAKTPATGLEQRKIAGIHVFGFAADEDQSGYTADNGGPFSFYLHHGNNWTFDMNYAKGETRPPGGEWINPSNESDSNACRNKVILGETGQENDNDFPEDKYNCVAIRAKWDNGNLSGFYTASGYEAEDGADTIAIPAQIDLLYREACEQIVVTSDNGKALQPNIAWTDRMINGTLSGGGFVFDHKSKRFSAGDESLKPYGYIPVKFFKSMTPPFEFITQAGTGPVEDIVYNWYAPIFKSDGGSDYTQVGVDDAVPPTKYVFNRGYTLGGVPYSCRGPCKGTWSNLGVDAWKTGETNLSKLFAVAWQTYAWATNPNGDQRKYGAVGPEPTWDRRLDYMTDITAPKIVAADTSACEGPGICPEGPEGLTVNKVMKGDIVQHGGRLPVRIQYYAYADKDHMPIRRKDVDFGDKTFTVSGDPSYFKNRRGCDTDSTTGKCKKVKGLPKLICLTDNNGTWGVTKDSCETGYFEETKMYVCNVATLNTLSECTADSGYPCKIGQQACVFKPRVRIVDNWGQCNGKCPGMPGTGNVCANMKLDKDGVKFTNTEEGCTNNADPKTCNECGSKYLPSNAKQSWTEFAGRIVLYAD